LWYDLLFQVLRRRLRGVEEAVTTDSRAVHEAIAHLYGAVMAPEEWPSALETVTDLLGADHAIFLDRGLGDSYGLLASVRLDPQIIERFCTAEAARLGDPFLGALPVGMAISRPDIVADREWENTAIYNEIIRPANGFQSVNARLEGPGKTAIIVNFCRARRAGAFDVAETAAFQTILPHLANVLELSHRLGVAERQHRGLLQILDCLDSGVILADAAGRPNFANDQARRILAAADGLMVGPSGLLAGTPPATLRLRQAINGVGALARPDTRAAAWQAARLRLARPSGRPPLMLSLYPIWRIDTAMPRVGIFVSEPDVCPPIDGEALVDAFRLTQREAAIAGLLASGHDLKSAAGVLAIGIGTARNHLKHVFEKTDTHSQAKLMAVLRGFVGPRR